MSGVVVTSGVGRSIIRGGEANIQTFVSCIVNVFGNQLFFKECKHEYMNMTPIPTNLSMLLLLHILPECSKIVDLDWRIVVKCES